MTPIEGMLPLRTSPQYIPLGANRPNEPADAKLSPTDKRKALEAARGFEAIFVSYLMKAMRGSVPQTGFFGRTFESDTYQQMFDERLSQTIAEGKGLGLADMLYREIVRQETGRIAYEALRTQNETTQASTGDANTTTGSKPDVIRTDGFRTSGVPETIR